MELSGGEAAAKRASSPTGEDRISALPNELLLTILLFLNNAADAARTSVLSRRWRPVWTLLPDLRVPFFPEPLSFRRAVTASQLRLHYLRLQGDGATPKSLAIWLPAAARRLSGTLVLENHAPDPEGMPATSRVLEREKKGRFFEMPCFENATKIFLDLGFLHTFMPLAGVFAQLTILFLERVWFDGACLVGDKVSSSSWRCPCLQVLKIRNAHAPRLVFLKWSDSKGQCSVELGQMPHLKSIGDLSYIVYGPNGFPDNAACMKLLQPFKAVESLALALAIMRDLSNYQYLMEDMKVLPNPAILYLNVLANGHSFGACSFHVLRMCVGIKKLVFVLLDNVGPEAKTPCLPGCVCNEQPNWKTEELLLINLQEIEIQLWGGSEHEVSFVKRLLNWATTLNKMTVTLVSSLSESNAKELFQMFKSLSKPEVCMKLMYHNNKKVLYAT